MEENISVVTTQHIPQSINGLKVRPDVGTLDAPDSHYRPILYSPIAAQKEHQQLNKDVYEQSRPYKPKKKKIPVAVWVILGSAALAFPIFKFIKKLIK